MTEAGQAVVRDAVHARRRSNSLVVLGPLAIYSAKPYANLPETWDAVEHVPRGSAVRWIWARPGSLLPEWGLRRVSLPYPAGLRLLAPRVRALIGGLLAAEFRDASAVAITSPFQDSLCDVLPDMPLIYHVFDDYMSYGWTDDVIGERETTILRHARHVVVVSETLARHYRDRYGVPDARISVIPNGYEPAGPRPAPPDLPSTAPVRIGTLGNVNSRLRLDTVLEILEAVPWASWTFVGGVGDDPDPVFREALEKLRVHPRCAFVGAKPYDELSAYAARFDVAVFPFSAHLLNRASSPTRFFSQLPFGQPILASDECDQLVSLQPLVRVCRSAESFISALNELKATEFHDAHEAARIEYATTCTWAARGRQLASVLDTVIRDGRRAGRPSGPSA